ncbi:hypothetical protein HK104_011357 [Borealophlyctis nickersoniae]|nr:hypothetical protein HK104_011357 [Borealophlyctis nickersoniae]
MATHTSEASSSTLPPSYSSSIAPHQKINLVRITSKTLTGKVKYAIVNLSNIACIKETPTAAEVTLHTYAGVNLHPKTVDSLDVVLRDAPEGEFIVFKNKSGKRTAVRAAGITGVVPQTNETTKIYYRMGGEFSHEKTTVVANVSEVAKALDPGFVVREVERDKMFFATLYRNN